MKLYRCIFQSTLPTRGATRLSSATRSIWAFQSTLPARGATTAQHPDSPARGHFNPRSPHGERRGQPREPKGSKSFQSTLPARGATAMAWAIQRVNAFQSTLPARGATLWRTSLLLRARNFNPRSPHGERLVLVVVMVFSSSFQSTLPVRGATLPARSSQSFSRDFNPRSPHGERRRHCRPRRPACPISIHAPRTGSDAADGFLHYMHNQISIHAPRTGSDVIPIFSDVYMHGISIHAPRTGSDIANRATSLA